MAAASSGGQRQQAQRHLVSFCDVLLPLIVRKRSNVTCTPACPATCFLNGMSMQNNSNVAFYLNTATLAHPTQACMFQSSVIALRSCMRMQCGHVHARIVLQLHAMRWVRRCACMHEAIRVCALVLHASLGCVPHATGSLRRLCKAECLICARLSNTASDLCPPEH